MSNVKRIDINGTLPFDCDNHAEMMRWLAHLNAPGNGVRITYSETPDFIPNPDGTNGQTAMYGFSIFGFEAWSWDAIDAMKKAIVACGGTVNRDQTVDIEG